MRIACGCGKIYSPKFDWLRHYFGLQLDTDDALYQAAMQAQAFDDANPEENAPFAIAMTDGLDLNETFDVAKLNALCQN